MSPRRLALVALALGTLLMGVPGCMEDIALFPRPTLPEAEPDVVGTIERVDLAARRLYLRDGEPRIIAYSEDAQVFYRGQVYPLSHLVPGDIVAMQVKRDQRGESYVDLIRIQQQSAGNRSSSEDLSWAPQIETLAGTVESINRRDNSFELDNRRGQNVLVALSENVRASDRERVRTLRSGDHVRVEGKFIERKRFEMLSFLNDPSS